MIANCLNAALIDDVLEASAFPGVNISCPKNQWRLGLFASLGHFLCVSDAGSIKDHRRRRTNCYWPGHGFPLRVGSTLPMCSRRWRKLVGRGNGIQPDSSLAVGMVAWMPQQRINRFRFLPLERRRRHFDRPPFRFACGWTGNFRIAKFAICGQRLATLVLGRESPDWGCLLLQGAATYGVKDIWMVAALCTTSRADGARASGVMTFGNRPVTFGYLSVGMTCTSPRSLTTRVGGRRVVHFPRVEADTKATRVDLLDRAVTWRPDPSARAWRGVVGPAASRHRGEPSRAAHGECRGTHEE